MTKTSKHRKIVLLREKIKRKCATNFLYFIESWCWIEGKTEEGVAIPFKLWPSQQRILPDFLSSKLLIILKARQLGLTWMAAAYCLWIVLFQRMKLIVVVSAKEEWAAEFLDRVRFMRQRLPGWLMPEIEKDGSQHMRVVFSRTDNGKMLDYSEIKSLATTVEGAQGKTPDVLVMDETSRNRYAKEIYGASKPGIDKAGGRIIVISNSHKRGWGWGWTREIYVKSMQGKNKFKRIFMPWWDCPERTTPAEKVELRKNPQFIPVDFRQKQLESGYDEDDFIENYPESEDQAISSLVGSYFGKSLARHSLWLTTNQTRGIKGNFRRDEKTGNYVFEPDQRGILEVWRWPYHVSKVGEDVPWMNRYCIGSDVSEGLGQSYSVAYVKDRLTDEYVARMRSNRIDAYQWADFLIMLANFYCHAAEEWKKWFRKETALICVETTGPGQTTVKHLKEKDARLYIQMVRGKVGSEIQKRFGWHESNQAKFDLSEDLRHYFKHTKGHLYCPILIEEASRWVIQDGKIGPENENQLGDCVIAAGLAEQASIFVGMPPKQIPKPISGWREDYPPKEGEVSNWVV
jgi:hypothetical protein